MSLIQQVFQKVLGQNPAFIHTVAPPTGVVKGEVDDTSVSDDSLRETSVRDSIDRQMNLSILNTWRDPIRKTLTMWLKRNDMIFKTVHQQREAKQV